MIKIEAIPAYQDNYIWCMYDQHSRQAVVVDPGDAQPVLQMLAARQLVLDAIIITHHHFDHVGGVDDLLAANPVSVYGPVNDTIPQLTDQLVENDHVELLGLDFTVFEVPGHTLDHIAFFSTATDDQPILFCGDTLFAGGCGRLFEGDAAMMHHSLSKLAALPAQTRVYCAHEYTLANLDFAIAVEPDNADLQQRIKQDRRTREQSLPTVPSALALEKATNPFLRCDTGSIIDRAQQIKGAECVGAAEVFATIRNWKDNF